MNIHSLFIILIFLQGDALQKALDEIQLKYTLTRERELRIKATQVANALKEKCDQHDKKFSSTLTFISSVYFYIINNSINYMTIHFSGAIENQTGGNPNESYDGLVPRETLNSQPSNNNNSVTFPIRKISLLSGIMVKKNCP